MSYERDKAFSNRLLPEIEQCLRQGLEYKGPIGRRQGKQFADMLILELGSDRVGCRIRRFHQWKYSHQFTIRTKRPQGHQTELDRILDGWCDYYFYGFADESEKRLHAWKLCRFRVFRERMTSSEHRINPDQSSEFNAYNWDSFPGSFVLTQGGAFAVTWRRLNRWCIRNNDGYHVAKFATAEGTRFEAWTPGIDPCSVRKAHLEAGTQVKECLGIFKSGAEAREACECHSSTSA